MMNANNSKLIVGMLALSLALPLALTTGQAQSGPSAKVTAKTSALNLIEATTGTNDWATISGFANTIKTANQKDLFIGVSLEVGLYTQTLVKSKNLVSDTSTAHSSVEIRVLVDGKAAEPGPVVYGRRTQTLTATLEGAIAKCLTIVTNANGSLSIVLDPDCVTPEEIELILDTMDAATFNFVAVDVPQGLHEISVQAKIIAGTEVQTGSATAFATVGKGTLTVESVRLIKDEDVVLTVD